MKLFLQFFPILIIIGILNACQAQPKKPRVIRADFLHHIRDADEFAAMQGEPLTEKYGNVTSLKVIYAIKTRKIYFAQSKKYRFHFEFCFAQFAGNSDLNDFNKIEYSDSPERHYLLANLNYYAAQNVYTLEFFADDKASAKKVRLLYDTVKANVFFADRLKLLVNSEEMENKMPLLNDIPHIQVDELYKNQTYQCLNKGVAYGYLRKIPAKEVGKSAVTKHDIILCDGIPNDFPYAAGMITAVFQTPLCHINILSSKRGTPNAALRNVWNDARINSLVDKLVVIQVWADSISINPTSEANAKSFWAKERVPKRQVLKRNLGAKSLLSIHEIRYKNVDEVGGKAANFGELSRVHCVDGELIPMPEAAFAIPFYFYQNHIDKNKLQPLINEIIADKKLLSNRIALDKKLKILRDSIKHCPIDPAFIAMVSERCKKTKFTDFRFRSSTNAEDVPGFNGAGLYVSKTGSLTNKEKPIDEAIKKVWASLWDIRPYEERENAGIEQLSLAMGILVHRAFGDEAANGVAITRHLYRKNFPGHTINVQKGETSVVLPDDPNTTCDQFILHDQREITGLREFSVEYVNKSSLNGGKPVMTKPEIDLLAKYLLAIKEHFYYKTDYAGNMDFTYFAMDIEFKLERGTRKLYIKQARLY